MTNDARVLLSPEHREAIVTAILAVNSFPIERVQKVLPALRAAQLLDPTYVASLDLGPLTVQLYNAGYDRGMLTSRIAERLQALMKAIREGQLDELEAFIRDRDAEKATAALVKVWGVGPKVALEAWNLLASKG